MLGKLIKHEFKATKNLFLFGWMITLITFAVMSLTQYLFSLVPDFESNSVLFGFLTVGATFMIPLSFCLIPACYIAFAYRFYKNLMKDEGYLMFTLPVKPWHHIFSKLLVSIVWLIGTGIVIIAGIYILCLGIFSMQDFGAFLTNSFDFVKDIFLRGFREYSLEFILYGAYLAVGVVSGILQIFVSISIGQSFGKHKLAASLVTWLIVMIASGMVSSLIQIFIMVLTRQASGGYYYSSFDTNLTTGISLGLNVIFCVVYFAVSNYMLKRKLNLE